MKAFKLLLLLILALQTGEVWGNAFNAIGTFTVAMGKEGRKSNGALETNLRSGKAVAYPKDYYAALPDRDEVDAWQESLNRFQFNKRIRVTFRNKSLILPLGDAGPTNNFDNYWASDSARLIYDDLN